MEMSGEREREENNAIGIVKRGRWKRKREESRGEKGSEEKEILGLRKEGRESRKEGRNETKRNDHTHTER